MEEFIYQCIFGAIVIFLIWQILRNKERIKDLRYNLNDAKFEIRLMGEEQQVIDSQKDKEKIRKEYKDYYNGRIDNCLSSDQAMYRRKRDEKTQDLNQQIILNNSQVEKIINGFQGNWLQWLKIVKITKKINENHFS